MLFGRASERGKETRNEAHWKEYKKYKDPSVETRRCRGGAENLIPKAICAQIERRLRKKKN